MRTLTIAIGLLILAAPAAGQTLASTTGAAGSSPLAMPQFSAQGSPPAFSILTQETQQNATIAADISAVMASIGNLSMNASPIAPSGVMGSTTAAPAAPSYAGSPAAGQSAGAAPFPIAPSAPPIQTGTGGIGAPGSGGMFGAPAPVATP
ncbi:MAG: hypothetical protein JOZ38_08550 [Candidatus Eremiobacteraeota bacterium]|nr:hypothetical protein [Candidatus Eremiobacteraeota bacterium]